MDKLLQLVGLAAAQLALVMLGWGWIGLLAIGLLVAMIGTIREIDKRPVPPFPERGIDQC